ncbi:hypothetical protein M2475_002121, partial [Breznakia sp. PF5-3]|nr:hypothetical protein [Breznakia sp. PM6-1]MDF9836540.1 hypothetical protein [Breznakia sp. PF5-3]
SKTIFFLISLVNFIRKTPFVSLLSNFGGSHQSGGYFV